MPTPAQTKFAAGIVAGKTKTDAYALAHPNDRSKRKVKRVQASRQSQTPAVLAEIARLQAELWARPLILESCPDANNPVALRAHAMATMIRLTGHHDAQVAFMAARDLRDYADKIEALHNASTPPSESKQLVSDLQALYRKALAKAPIVETTADPVIPDTNHDS